MYPFLFMCVSVEIYINRTKINSISKYRQTEHAVQMNITFTTTKAFKCLYLNRTEEIQVYRDNYVN